MSIDFTTLTKKADAVQAADFPSHEFAAAVREWIAEATLILAAPLIRPLRPVSWPDEKEEPEPKVCPHCGDLTSEPHWIESEALGILDNLDTVKTFTCTRHKSAHVVQNFCPNCGERTPYSHKSHHDDHYTCEPEPVAAGEMPHSVRNAAAGLRQEAGKHEHGSRRIALNMAAMRLEQERRSQPALRMTEELESVLAFIELNVRDCEGHGSYVDTTAFLNGRRLLLAKVAAVRAQAAQGVD